MGVCVCAGTWMVGRVQHEPDVHRRTNDAIRYLYTTNIQKTANPKTKIEKRSNFQNSNSASDGTEGCLAFSLTQITDQLTHLHTI